MTDHIAERQRRRTRKGLRRYRYVCLTCGWDSEWQEVRHDARRRWVVHRNATRTAAGRLT